MTIQEAEFDLHLTLIEIEIKNDINIIEESKKKEHTNKSSISILELRIFLATLIKHTENTELKKLLNAAIKALEKMEINKLPPPPIKRITQKSPTLAQIIHRK